MEDAVFTLAADRTVAVVRCFPLQHGYRIYDAAATSGAESGRLLFMARPTKAISELTAADVGKDVGYTAQFLVKKAGFTASGTLKGSPPPAQSNGARHRLRQHHRPC